MIKKIKTWFRSLLLRWAKGVEIERWEELNSNFNVEWAKMEETLQNAKNAVAWLRSDNEKLLDENAKLYRPITTIRATVDLNTSPSWANCEVDELKDKLKFLIQRQIGDACFDYIVISKDWEKNILLCDIDILADGI